MGGGKRSLCPLRTDTCNGVAYAYIRKTRRKQDMNEELRKLLDSIRAKKQEVKDLCRASKIEDAAAAKEELKGLQAQFDLLYDL